MFRLRLVPLRPRTIPSMRAHYRFGNRGVYQEEEKSGLISPPLVTFRVEAVVRAGIEPATHGFSVHCSTN